MARKIETGNVHSMTPTRTVTWNRGRRTVVKSYTQVNRKTGEFRRVTDTSSLNILGIVLLVLLFASIAAILAGSNEPKTFGGFLEMLTTVPDVSIPWQSIDITGITLPDWLSWATPFLEFLEMLITVGAFFVNGIWQSIKLAFWVIKWLFA